VCGRFRGTSRQRCRWHTRARQEHLGGRAREEPPSLGLPTLAREVRTRLSAGGRRIRTVSTVARKQVQTFAPPKWCRSRRPNDSESRWRVLGRAALLKVGPRVRIRLPPAASQVRTRVGVQALILILDNHEFFRQVGVALTTVIPRKRTGLIAAIVGMGRRPRADRLLPIGGARFASTSHRLAYRHIDQLAAN
jgi:hypothetical protein